MIVRTTEEITGTDRQRDTENWTSKRIVLADDGVGFSFHETTIHPGAETPLHYPDYIEAVWIVEGHGQLIDRDHGATHRLAPGTMYLLDKHDRHTIVADSRIRALCVFVPAVPPGSP